MQPGPIEQPPAIPPQPVQEQWIYELVPMTNGSQLVRITIHGPSGSHVSFMPPEIAVQIGEAIAAVGKQGTTGLILPPSARNGHGHG